jgi:hypothetical protein
MVCSGQLPLARAQHIIATGWISWARSHGEAGTSSSSFNTSGAPGPSGAVHCRDFTTHAQAQQWFVAHGGSASHDVAGLDGNHDGVACEDLP